MYVGTGGITLGVKQLQLTGRMCIVIRPVLTDGVGTPDPSPRNLANIGVSNDIIELVSHVSKLIFRGSSWGWGFRSHWLGAGEDAHHRRGEGYLSIYLSLSLSLYTHIYIYICTYIYI